MSDLKALVFGGTSEGRALAEWLLGKGIPALVSVATDYGGELLPDGVERHVGRLSGGEMRSLMRSGGFDIVVDATHPYASAATETIAAASAAEGLEYVRLLRGGDERGEWLSARDAAEAAEMLLDMPGRVLLTTGSKELAAFAPLAGRACPRVLPSMASLEKCLSLGFPAKDIICMQGPFTREMNEAMIRQYGIDILVTKLTGSAGGFSEKVEAARSCGCRLLVIERPTHESGLALGEVERLLEERWNS